MPSTLYHQRSLNPKYGQNSNPKLKPSGTHPIKLALSHYEDYPEPAFWFNAICSISDLIHSIFSSVQQNQRVYRANLKLWQFNFDCYDALLKILHESKFSDIEEIPRFL